MEMTFGKHKGEQLADIPTEYLAWVLENCATINRHLRDEIKLEIENREDDTIAVMGRNNENSRARF
jgi:hypothetical protein